MDAMNHASRRSAGLFPPDPSRRSSTGTDGQKLLTMLRALEKSTEGELMEEFATTLATLTSKTLREGILSGDAEQASRILSVAAVSKRNRPSRDARGTSTSTEVSGATEASTAHDGQLLLSTIARILDSSPRKSVAYNQCWDLLVKLAATFLTAWASFVASQTSVELTVLAEYELLSANGKQLLSLLCNAAGTRITESIAIDQALRRPTAEDGDRQSALLACLEASTAIVLLLGTKLSRSVQVMNDMHAFCVKTLVVADEAVVAAAARLIACLPTAGGIDGATPVALWEGAVQDCTNAMSVLVRAVVVQQLKPASTDNIDSKDSQSNKRLAKYVHDVLDQIREESSEHAKVQKYVHLMGGFCSILCHLLECSPAMAGPSTATINVAALLEVIELMISCPVAAENVYHNTKKRLRYETVGDALLSPAAIAQDVANQLKYQGLQMMSQLLKSVGGSSLAPFSDRLKKSITSSLQNSLSMTLRSVVDPASVDLDAKDRKRWLHLSICLRKQGVEVFAAYISTFGGDAASSASRSSRHAPSLTEVGILSVGGIVVEELTTASAPSSKCWGAYKEQSDLLTAALSCLEASLSVGGVYMSENLRQFVDSVAKRALLALTSVGATRQLKSCQSAAFSLGIACVLSSWPDGSMSWLVRDLLSTAQQCQKSAGHDAIVQRAISVCNAALSPRVPALIVRVQDRRDVQQSRRVVSLKNFDEAIEKEQHFETSPAVPAESPSDMTGTGAAVPTSKAAAITAPKAKSKRPSKSQAVDGKRLEAKKRQFQKISETANRTTSPHQEMPDVKLQETNDDAEGDLAFPSIIDMGPDEGDCDDD